MKSSHLLWAKKEQTSKEIDLGNLFNDYWASEAHELKVTGQSSQSQIHLYLMD